MAELIEFVPLFAETLATVRARYDADANAGIDPAEDAFVDLTPGGFYFDLTQPSALESERLWDVVATVLPASMFPQFAWGDYLDEWGVLVGIERKDSVKATGEVTFAGTVGTPIASDTRLSIVTTDPDDDPVEFVTTQATTLRQSPAPVGLGATPGSAGTLPARTYYYRVTAVLPTGETVSSVEVSTVIPAQFLAAPTGLGGTAFTTGGTLANGTYYYKVTALNANGETIGSAEINRAVTGPTGRVDLTWTAVSGATSYRIYRGTSTGAQNVYYTSATNSYSDTGSAGTSGTVPGTATAQIGQVVLDWTDYAGATSYKVYRSTVTGEERFLASSASSGYSDTGAAVTTSEIYPTNTVGIEAAEAGSAGNVAAQAISQLVTPIEGIASVSNAEATSGGADVETDELLSERVVLEFSTRPGAGTVNDYERWARGYAPIGYATVTPLWAGPGTVRLMVTDQSNSPVAVSVVAGLQNLLDPTPGMGMGQAPIGAIVTVATPSTLAVTPVATLTLLAGYSLDGTSGTIAVRSNIESAIKGYIDKLPPGDDVIWHNVRAQFFKVPGVLDVPSLTLNGTSANLTIGATEVARTGTVTLS